MIDFGADVNLETIRGATPLIEAAKGNFAQLANLLLQRGALIQYRSKHRMNAAEWALRYEHKVLAEELHYLTVVAEKQPAVMAAINTCVAVVCTLLTAVH